VGQDPIGETPNGWPPRSSVNATPAIVMREGRDFMISTLAPGPAQVRFALVVAFAFFAAYALLFERTSVQLAWIDAVVPSYATDMFISDMLTAFLLFAQFSILRSLALLVISAGYLYTGLIMVPWILTFPGTFAPGGLIGAGLQSAVWLYTLWHFGFPLFVIGYALVKNDDPAKGLWRASLGMATIAVVAAVASIVVAVTVLVTVGQDLLPPLSLDIYRQTPIWPIMIGCLSLLSLVAAILLWFRRRSVLDLWLTIVMFAFALELFMASGLLAGHHGVNTRFSVAWYGGRIFSLLSANTVLFVLLYETTTLYARLLRAVLAQGRERNARLITGDTVSASIAHEVKQPFSAMTTNADAGLRWLKQESPDLEQVKAALRRIATDGHRAGAMVENVRAIFRKNATIRMSLDVGELVSEALALVVTELRTCQIAVNADLEEKLPCVAGDQQQLQHVLLNLLVNAIDSMATVSETERNLRICSKRHESGGVAICIEDQGARLAPDDLDCIFDPFFTTKSSPMDMGLAICRSIVEAHQGSLSALPNTPRGIVFQLVLPAGT
jgi:signal transduction histidine kinase